ncbi:traD_6 (plasmid) [Escherichia coli]|nr:traD_6 [Escherichia coli]
MFGIQSYAQLEDIYGEKAAATLFDVLNTRAFSAPRAIRLQSLLPVKLVRKST